MIFDQVLDEQKGRSNISQIKELGTQSEKGQLVLEGSAREAVCRGGERKGVLL